MFWYLPSWDLSVIRKFFVCPSPTQIPLIESKNSRYIFFATFNTYHQTESRCFFLSPTPHIWLRKATYPSEWPRDRPRSWLDQCAWEKPRCSSHLPGSDPRGRFIATWCVGKPVVGWRYISAKKWTNDRVWLQWLDFSLPISAAEGATIHLSKMSSLKLFVCVFCFFFFASKATSKVSTSVSTPINRSTTLADLKTKIQQLLRFPAFQCKRPHHKLDMCKLYNQYEYVYIFTHHIDSSETPVSAFHPGGLLLQPFLKLQVLRNGWWKNTASTAENSEADKPSAMPKDATNHPSLGHV